MFVKLGVVPLWFTARFAPLTSIVPLLRCAALAGSIVIGWRTVSVPWLSSWARSVRDPPVPTAEVMVPPAALVSVTPAGIASMAL